MNLLGTTAVFVYGTLRTRPDIHNPGRRRHAWAGRDALAVLPAYTRGTLYDGPGYPYALFQPHNETLIRGEVHVYPNCSQDLGLIHDVETGAGYDRIEIQVHLPNGITIGAESWQLNPWQHNARSGLLGGRITSGDWFDKTAPAFRDVPVFCM